MRVVTSVGDEVWVRLSHGGNQHYAQYLQRSNLPADEIQAMFDTAKKSGGWWSFQLGDLMFIFGRRLASDMREPMFEGGLIYHTSPLP